MIKRKLTKLEKILLVTVAIAGSFYFYLNRVYDPKLNQYQAILEETAQLQQEVAGLGEAPNLTRISDRVEEGRLVLRSQEGELELLLAEKKARSEDAVTEVIDNMNRLAVKNSITLQVLKISLDEAAKEEPAPSKKLKAKEPEEESGPVDQELSLPDAAGEMEWQEFQLELAGAHRNLVDFISGLKDMERVIMLNSFGVSLDEDSGKFDIVMTVLI